MIDIDDDGDLDIYMSINGRNRLYINQLPAANRNNHLIIDVTEDRGANGSTGGVPERVAIGTNILIRDCNGNIISGLRQVNGVFGHGTQSPEEVHFGLPLGENETYVIEVHYPNYYDPVDGFTRLIGTIITTPSTIPGTNHYTLSTTDAELSENVNAPDAVDDVEIVPMGTSVSVQLSLFDNDFEPDGESFFISSIVQPAIGSVVIDDAALGLVTYTYSSGTYFQGTTFDYSISDSPITTCPALGKSDTATVTIVEPCADLTGLDSDGDGINDTCDLDDDNDGILDATEGLCLDPTGISAAFSGGASGTMNQGAASADYSVILNATSGYAATTYTAGARGLELRYNQDNIQNPDSYNNTFSVANVSAGYTPIIRVQPIVQTTSGSNSAAKYTITWTGGTGYAKYVDNAIPNINMYRFEPGNALPNTGPVPVGFDINERQVKGLKTEGAIVNGGQIFVYALDNADTEWYVELPLGVTSVTIDMETRKTGISSSDGEDFRLPVLGWGTDSSGYAANEWISYSVELLPDCNSLDTDNDGIANYLDLDSDNDGCFDALEGDAGLAISQLDQDGSISGNTDTNGIPLLVSGGQNDLSSTNNAITSGFCDDDGDGITNSSDLCVGYDDNLDYDNDLVPDGCDLDDDNDGIFDLVECPPLPGIIEPQSDALEWGYGDFRVFTIGGNTNALGYQESGFLKEAYARGYNLTTLTGASDFSFTGATGPGSATSSIGSFANGTMTFSTSYITNNNAEFRTTTSNAFISGATGQGVYVFPEQGGIAGDFYSVHINFTTPVTAFSFDFVDIFDTVVTDDPVLNYEVYVDGILVAYIKGPVSDVGDDGTGLLSVYNGGNAIQGMVTAGQNLENTFGFVTYTPVNNVEIRHKVESGNIIATARDPHGLDNFSYSTDLQCTNSKNGDSDGDGCSDSDEAYGDPSTDTDDNGMFGSGSPTVDTDGTVDSASYTTPLDTDSSGIYDFLEVGIAPSIATQPVDMSICTGCNTTISVTTSNADSYQWQIFNGSTWIDLIDLGIHSGTSTATLSITNASSVANGNQYRVVVSNTLFVCDIVISNSAILTVNVSTVITNRRITYRLKKN